MAGTDESHISREYLTELEHATRGLFALNVSILEQIGKRVGLAQVRALQSLDRRGSSLVTELGADLHLLPSTASRLSDRLAEAGLISRRIAPTNRRATLLELTDAGRAVLDELTNRRIQAFGDVVARMTERDRVALVRGSSAFTRAQATQAESARAHPRRSRP